MKSFFLLLCLCLTGSLLSQNNRQPSPLKQEFSVTLTPSARWISSWSAPNASPGSHHFGSVRNPLRLQYTRALGGGIGLRATASGGINQHYMAQGIPSGSGDFLFRQHQVGIGLSVLPAYFSPDAKKLRWIHEYGIHFQHSKTFQRQLSTDNPVASDFSTNTLGAFYKGGLRYQFDRRCHVQLSAGAGLFYSRSKYKQADTRSSRIGVGVLPVELGVGIRF